MEATDILHAQHREIEQLFKRITGGGNGHQSVATVVDALIGKLQIHTRLEETIFYPTVRKLDTKKVEEVVLESYEEHSIVDFLVAQLPAMDYHGERFLARVRVLQSLVEEHVQEEEEQLFRLAEKLDEARREELAVRLRDELGEVERVHELLDTAARAARRTESWAGSLLDIGFGAPRRAVSAFAPSRMLGLDRRGVWTARIADVVPRFVVDTVYWAVAKAPARRAA